jgi:hypothetical protein
MGNGLFKGIRHILYVSEKIFNFAESYKIAREVGKINNFLEGGKYILIGPGRWGTTNPELGIPVEYGEISNAIMIVEVATKQVTPELSYGTHFFGDLVSTNIVYAPIFPEKRDYINMAYLDNSKNLIDSKYVKLIETTPITIFADGKNRKAVVLMD